MYEEGYTRYTLKVVLVQKRIKAQDRKNTARERQTAKGLAYLLDDASGLLLTYLQRVRPAALPLELALSLRS